MSAKPWFETKLDQEETVLEENGVPPQYWGYILANGEPDTIHHDGRGAIYGKRQHLIESILKSPESRTMGVTVIDGRNTESIRKWIGGSDWTPEEENAWLETMKPKN